MTVTDLAALDLDLFDGLADELAAEAEVWLHDPARTAHRLVTAPTAELVRIAAADQSTVPEVGPQLPGGLWRLMPDRLLSHRPVRRAERLDRLRISPEQHLLLTALVLERWGWAQSGGRLRTSTGRRCILGAQRAVHALGYGTEHIAVDAGRQIQGVLSDRRIRTPYPEWNEQPGITGAMALAVVRTAAKES